ncbi:unnamed protein product [Rangifer tarandus platyrhynchus]|uniref:Uncharacterized protein n=2 Tax=Rangifer tarandus platyrhynchus TaxID=3082113 RepID=A0ABN8ZCG4_RANTA|nr:unnamed protein product [Rangifer tarandus platyrhynchus]
MNGKRQESAHRHHSLDVQLRYLWGGVLGFLALSASVPGWLQLLSLPSESPQDSLSRAAVAVGRMQPLCPHSESPQDSLSRAAVAAGRLQRRWSAHASVSRSVVSDPTDCSPPGFSVGGILCKNAGAGFMPPPGHLPASAGGRSTTGAACRGCHAAACSVRSPAGAVWRQGVSARAPAGLCSWNPHLQQERT